MLINSSVLGAMRTRDKELSYSRDSACRSMVVRRSRSFKVTDVSNDRKPMWLSISK